MDLLYQVSIIIPTYNRSVLLRHTLQSVENQTYKNWECIIVNDGKENRTKKVVNEFIAINPRFKYFQRPDNFARGACGSRNFGFEMSKGKYIQWLDDDDLLSPNKLEFQVKKLSEIKDPKVFTTCSWDVYWDSREFQFKNIFCGEEKINGKDFFIRLRRYETFIPLHAFLTHRYLIKKAGPWNTSLIINQDGEFFTRIVLAAKSLINTSGCYVLYRIHDGSRISEQKTSKKLIALLEGYQMIQSHLKSNLIENKQFFRWKLYKLFLEFWKSEPEILKKYEWFFNENNIYFQRANYYFLKLRFYQILMPFYKKFK